MMRYIFILALCALMGCDEKEVIEPLAITPSGWPEAIFKTKAENHCPKPLLFIVLTLARRLSKNPKPA